MQWLRSSVLANNTQEILTYPIAFEHYFYAASAVQFPEETSTVDCIPQFVSLSLSRFILKSNDVGGVTGSMRHSIICVGI